MNALRPADTIAAVATPPGEGGIAVLRLSGPATRAVIAKAFKPSTSPLKFIPRKACFGEIIDNQGQVLDNGFLTFFKGPASYTGEDLAEFSCHGGRLITERVLARLIECGARPAEPGEFTRRAFLNGRMDLVQAEAVAALIRADTEEALLSARRELDGRLSARFRALSDRLSDLLSLVESSIEFSDEEGVGLNLPKTTAEIQDLIRETGAMAATWDEGRRLTEGLRVVIAGPPNAGKSSLFNALVERERVIVDSHPGTTRDLVEETVSLRGRKVILVDTAGIRPKAARVEARGVALARKAVSEADLVLLVFDASATPRAKTLATFKNLDCRKRIFVLNKSDRKSRFAAAPAGPVFRVSARSGLGLSELKDAVVGAFGGAPTDGERPVLTSLRQRILLEKSAASLKAALKVSGKKPLREELLALELTAALSALESITGRVTDDDILNRIFSRFCIGK